jgi:hypothetical protein
MENDSDIARGKAVDWLDMAVNELDRRFGVGFAKGNPALLAACVQAVALAWHGARLDDAAGRMEEVVSSLGLVAKRLE